MLITPFIRKIIYCFINAVKISIKIKISFKGRKKKGRRGQILPTQISANRRLTHIIMKWIRVPGEHGSLVLGAELKGFYVVQTQSLISGLLTGQIRPK